MQRAHDLRLCRNPLLVTVDALVRLCFHCGGVEERSVMEEFFLGVAEELFRDRVVIAVTSAGHHKGAHQLRPAPLGGQLVLWPRP